jgi:hypothetical protein
MVSSLFVDRLTDLLVVPPVLGVGLALEHEELFKLFRDPCRQLRRARRAIKIGKHLCVEVMLPRTVKVNQGERRRTRFRLRLLDFPGDP